MALFRGYFGGGGADDDRDESGAEIVEQLVERVETSAASEDRRDALRGLRGIAKKMRLHVGSMGMNALLSVLEKEQTNPEMLFTALDILVAVLNNDEHSSSEDELGERLAEAMLRKAPFIPAVLASITHYDFNVRRASVQLLTCLLRHRRSEVQDLVIQQPLGITKLVDLLHEIREVVRNEAVLMLGELSTSNTQVQQLLAYDNAFVLLFDVIDSEPLDSIVVEDCLFVILNLLRKNAINRQLFSENNLIPRLGLVMHQFLFADEGGEEEIDMGTGPTPPCSAENWPKQRTANVIFLLQVVRALVAPEKLPASGITYAAQKAMMKCKMLPELCRVLLSEMGVAVDVLTESVIAVAEVIRGNYTNQEYFASSTLETAEGVVRQSLIVLLLSMTSERQPFKLRCAVFYAFLSYLHDNEFGKMNVGSSSPTFAERVNIGRRKLFLKVISTLLPASQSGNSEPVTTGSLICQAISSSESIQSWFACISLLHCIIYVDQLPEQLLRVQLTVSKDETVGLLHHISHLIISTGNRRPQTRAGLLQLLGTWLHGCPAAVTAFVANDEILNHLTAAMLDERDEGNESEQQVLKGLIAFVLLTCRQNVTDEKTRASLAALMDRRVGKDRLADAIEGVALTEQYVRAAQKAQPLAKTPQELFLDYEFVKLFKSIEGKLVRSVRVTDALTSGPHSHNESIIQSFKDLIERQDEELSVLKHEVKTREAELASLRSQVASPELERSVQEAQSAVKASADQNKTLEAMVAELSSVNTQWREEVEKYKGWLNQWQHFQLAQLPNGGQDAVIQQLQYQVSNLEQQIAVGWQSFETQTNQLSAYAEKHSEYWKNRAEAAEKQLVEVNAARAVDVERKRVEAMSLSNGHDDSQEASKEVEKLQTEQGDILELLVDLDGKIGQYRKRLRALGQVVSDDEDE